MSSSEDEDLKYGYKKAPKRKQKYIHMNSSSESHVEDDEEDAVTDANDDYDNDFLPVGLGMNRNKRKRGLQHQAGKKRDSSSAAPVFVQGSTMHLESDDEDDAEKEDGEGNDNQQQQKLEPLTAAVDKANDEPTQEEPPEEEDPDLVAQKQQLQQERERANERFLALLNRGRGKRRQQQQHQRDEKEGEHATVKQPAFDRSTRHGFEEKEQVDGNDGAASYGGLGLGLGLGARRPPNHLPSHFGGQQQQHQLQPSVHSVSNLGSWEKHTKGFGSKLLAKMGYSGSGGLGKERKGVVKPVPVKVRPANLGLGFGNFKEATSTETSLLVNEKKDGKKQKQKQRGEQETNNLAGATRKLRQDLLPSVRELLEDESWRRGTNKGSSSKRTRRTVVPYTELLKQQNQQSYSVIDMRGPEASSVITDATKKHSDQQQETEPSKTVPLAEELLHNISLLLNTYENKVYSSSSFASSTEQRLASLESDSASIKERCLQGEERIEKLQTVLKLFDTMQELSSQDADDMPVDKIMSIVRQLTATFSAEERLALQFSQVFVPSLVGTFVQTKLDPWNPLSDSLEQSERLIRSIFSCSAQVASVEDENEQKAALLSMTRSLLTNHLLPHVKASLDSLQWDPIHDCERALSFYELLYGLVQEMDLKTTLEDTTESTEQHVLPIARDDETSPPKLLDLVKEELIHNALYIRLSRAIGLWTPQLDDNNKLADSPSHWVLPWIPHLDQHQALVPSIVSDCKKKIKSAVSHLQKSIPNDDDFVQAAMETLLPWKGVFKEKALQDIVSSYVTTRLARSLGKLPSKQDLGSPMTWGALDLTLDMHGVGLLSNRECLSLIEGEALACWTRVVHSKLSTAPSKVVSVVESYEGWKTRILCNPLAKKDSLLPRYFYAVLLMIRAAADANVSALDDLRPSSETSFRVVLARRTADDKRRAADDLLRMDMGEGAVPGLTEARVRLGRRSNVGHIPTFREVIAEFARERDILFQPRLGSNASKDGKQVYLFGKTPVYFDSNVVFALQESDWRPVNLEELVKLN